MNERLLLSIEPIVTSLEKPHTSAIYSGIESDSALLLVNNFAGIAGCKDSMLHYRACNSGLLKIAGVSEQAELLGKSDNELYWRRFHNHTSFLEEDTFVLEGNRILCMGMYDYVDRKRFIFKIKVPTYDKEGCINGTFFSIFELHPPFLLSLKHLFEYLNLKFDQDIQNKLQGWFKNLFLFPCLTNQETQCLKHILHGLTSKEIARKMDISYRTVEIYTQYLKEKYQARDKHELIIKGLPFADFL